MSNKYHNRLGYDLPEGERVRLEQNFKINHDPILSIGDEGTVKILHADYGKVWGVGFDNIGWVVSGEREGYGEAFVIENVVPIAKITEREHPQTVDADYIRSMLDTLISAPPASPSRWIDAKTGEWVKAPSPSADWMDFSATAKAEAFGLTWERLENAIDWDKLRKGELALRAPNRDIDETIYKEHEMTPDEAHKFMRRQRTWKR